MKRSEINGLIDAARDCFAANGWALPPEPRWDVTDFGLGDWQTHCLVLVNLAEEPEYCEKLMYARAGMTTPSHTHRKKKEDIICRWGGLRVQLWANELQTSDGNVSVKLNGAPTSIPSGGVVELAAGCRITLFPGTYHAFVPLTPECIIGEVSTANDDLTDNYFSNPEVGRFSAVQEDEPIKHFLLSDL